MITCVTSSHLTLPPQRCVLHAGAGCSTWGGRCASSGTAPAWQRHQRSTQSWCRPHAHRTACVHVGSRKQQWLIKKCIVYQQQLVVHNTLLVVATCSLYYKHACGARISACYKSRTQQDNKAPKSSRPNTTVDRTLCRCMLAVQRQTAGATSRIICFASQDVWLHTAWPMSLIQQAPPDTLTRPRFF
jgi:hypothetical protein